MKRKITSTAEDRAKNNPYSPFQSYTEYRDHMLIIALDINEIIEDMPLSVIPEIWMHDTRMRYLFRTAAEMAHYIHAEELLQKMLPWCQFNIKKYCTRFD